jgi:hypothetical protein
MTIVQQITDCSCFLACLESFFADAGREVTQQMIIDAFPEETHKGCENEGQFDLVGAEGATNAIRLQDKYGFKWTFRKSDFGELHPGCLIGAENMKDQGRNHIIRFFEYAGAERIKLMDPKKSDFDFWTRAEYLRWQCYVLDVLL